MKKIITFGLAVMLVCLALVACNQNTNKDPKDTSSSVTTTVKDTSKDTQKDSKNDTTTPKTPDTTPEAKAAFDGTVDEVLDLIINKAIEIDSDKEYGIGSIQCYHSPVDTDACDTILGLDDKEFNEYIEAAVESKHEGSWFTHSVVVVKLKDGVDVKTVAEKIIGKTEAVRFGCLRPQAIVGAYTGSFVVFTTSDKDKCEAVFEAVKALSGTEVTRVDREKNWSDSGLID